jgi:hypothetical protein
MRTSGGRQFQTCDEVGLKFGLITNVSPIESCKSSENVSLKRNISFFPFTKRSLITNFLFFSVSQILSANHTKGKPSSSLTETYREDENDAR